MAIRKRTGKRGVTWQIDYTDPTGKRVRRNFKKKKDAVAELGKRQSLIAEGSYLDHKKVCDVTIGKMVKIYTQEYEGQPSFHIAKARWLKNFEEFFGKDTILDKIGYSKIKDYRKHLETKPTHHGKVRKKSSINREMSCLRTLFKEAVERDILAINPFVNKKSLHMKEPGGKTRFLSQEEIDRLLSTTMPDHYRNIIVGILHTGMRRQEILGLQWHQMRDGFIYLHKTKTDKARQVPLDAFLSTFLTGLRHRHGLKSRYVFSNAEGQKVKGDTFSNALDSVMRRANIPNCTAHTLRHTFASHFVMRGGDLPSLQKILGHQEISMTMRYAHLAPDYLKKSIEVMGDLTGDTQKSDEKVTFYCHKQQNVSNVSNA